MGSARLQKNNLKFGVCLAAIAAVGIAERAAAQSATDDISLEEIIITAEKRSENIQDVPISVTVLSGAELQQRSAESLRDLQFAIPNLTLYSRTDFNPNFIIRGISSGARNIGFESSLGVYVDGVFMGRTSGFNQQLDDIERVEVLRGPQGTLFGKNTISGALNIATLRPGDEFDGRVSVEYGNFDNRRASGYLSGPIVEGVLSAKVSGFTSDRDGFVTNVNASGPASVDDENTHGFRGELRFTPNEQLDIALRGDWSKADRRVLDGEVAEIIDNPFGLPLSGDVPGVRTVSIGGDNIEDREISGGSVTVAYQLDSGHEIVSISALRHLEYALPNSDLDGEPGDFLSNNNRDELKQFTQELRIASPATDPFRYVAGVYYFNQNSDTSRSIVLGDDLRGILAGFGVPAAFITNLTNSGSVDTKSFAAFANVSFDVSDHLELDAGVRYNNEQKDFVFGQDGIDVLGLPTIAPFTDEIKEEDFSPTFGLNYKPSDDTLLYARFAKGFKSGGWNADILSSSLPSDIVFDAESINSYEFGMKTEMWDRRARLNIAVFQLNYKDIQISRFNNVTGGFETANAARARSRGFEVEFTAVPAAGFDVSAGIGYADAEFRSYPDAAPGVDLSGAPLDAPNWTVSASAQYSRPVADKVEAIGRLDYAYRSSAPGDGLDAFSGVDGFATLNGRVGLAWDSGLALYFWARNITNNDFVVSQFVGGNLASTLGVTQRFATYGSPRTYGVSLSFDF